MIYTAIEGFCGAGGLSLGLIQSGFSVSCAFDVSSKAVETHNHNIEGLCVKLDARHVDGSMLLDIANVKPGNLDLFAGGPPCQGFSAQNREASSTDKRNELVTEYIRITKSLMPRFFLLENVATFGRKRGKLFREAIESCLSDYVLVDHFYNCADYGLAQTRLRYIVVGKRKDIPGEFKIPAPTVSEWLTVGDVIGSLPDPPDDYSEHPLYRNHKRSKVTKKNIDRFSYVPQGGGWRDIPEEHRLECHKKIKPGGGGWSDVYGRLQWDGQCPTITGGFDSFTRGRYGHPLHNRAITQREAARLQGFPDSFVFLGSRSDVCSQIGNSVPPPLAKAIGESIINVLRGE